MLLNHSHFIILPSLESSVIATHSLISASALVQNNSHDSILTGLTRVMTSKTEADLVALYIMSRKAVYIRIILKGMGHKQPVTPLQTDNAMTDAVCNVKIKPKLTKAMDMQFHWLRDIECQKQFIIYWQPGK